jgi:hypothetical protein
MEDESPEPCNDCENFRRADVYGDGRMIAWCAYASDGNLGNPDCLYFSKICRDPTEGDD